MQEIKQTNSKTDFIRSLAEDEQYYRQVFKKTEKIVCAVFYTIRAGYDAEMSDILIKDNEMSAQHVMDAVHETLRVSLTERERALDELVFRLRALESKLRLLVAARLLAAELLEVFVREIEGVQRVLRRYRRSESANPLFTETELSLDSAAARRQTRERRPRLVSPGTPELGGHTTGLSRRERIRAVIKDKGEVTIKDIADIITDCSEKTIQRELIDMIKDGIISRKGERRWSRYSIV